MRLIRPVLLPASVCVTLALPIAQAHHSVAGFYDANKLVEIEGVVRQTHWRNPHTVFEVDVTADDGEVITWQLESGALGVLRSRGLGREFMQPGDRVKVLGDAAIRTEHELFARNILLQNGKEVLLTAGSRPYFSLETDSGILEAEYDQDATAVARANADGIFRVWSTDIDNRQSDRLAMFNGEYPLLAAAREAREEYDAGDEVLRGCTKWSMPRLMSNPLPMDFVRSGQNILQRFEEDDNVRTIYMNTDSAESSVAPSALGYSTGRWEGETLVVETSRLIPDRFDNLGTPFSEEIRLTERFSLSNDGNTLNYVLEVRDPNTFSEPFQKQRQWHWRPEILLNPYDCELDQQLR